MNLEELEEKESIERDYQTLLSISLKKGEDQSETYIYGDGPEIVGGTMMLLEEISKNFRISFYNFCEMLQALGNKRKMKEGKLIEQPSSFGSEVSQVPSVVTGPTRRHRTRLCDSADAWLWRNVRGLH